jgi:hypothetical protein
MFPMTTDATPIKAPPIAVLARGRKVAGAERDTHWKLRLITETVQGKG